MTPYIIYSLEGISETYLIIESHFTLILSSNRQSDLQFVSISYRKREPSSKAVEWESSLTHPACMLSFQHS